MFMLATRGRLGFWDLTTLILLKFTSLERSFVKGATTRLSGEASYVIFKKSEKGAPIFKNVT